MCIHVAQFVKLVKLHENHNFNFILYIFEGESSFDKKSSKLKMFMGFRVRVCDILHAETGSVMRNMIGIFGKTMTILLLFCFHLVEIDTFFQIEPIPKAMKYNQIANQQRKKRDFKFETTIIWIRKTISFR